MKDLLKKFPAPKSSFSLVPSVSYSPDCTLDLHGYTEEESLKKLEWLKQAIPVHQYKKIKIITGKGKGVLFQMVTRKLQNGFFASVSMHSWKPIANESGFEIVIL